MNNSIRSYSYIFAYGVISLLFSAVALLLTFGGHGFYTPLIVISSPIFGIFGVRSIVTVPLFWIIEVMLCLRNTWRCRALFIVLAVGGYIESIYMMMGDYFEDLEKCFQAWTGEWFWVFTIMIAIYLTTQITLWVLLFHTWTPKKSA